MILKEPSIELGKTNQVGRQRDVGGNWRQSSRLNTSKYEVQLNKNSSERIYLGVLESNH